MYILNEKSNTKDLNKQLNYLLELIRVASHQVFDVSTLKRVLKEGNIHKKFQKTK